MAEMEHSKWEAFRLVKADNVEALRGCLAPYRVDEWRHWRNFGGKTLLQLAEWEAARDSAGGSDCLHYLRERLANPDRLDRGFASPMRDPVFREVVEPVAREPMTREPMIREPAAREPMTRQPIVREPVVETVVEPVVVREPLAVPVEPVVVKEPFIPQRVIRPNVTETVVEVPSVQETTVVVEVPERHSHTIIKEVPNVNIHEETRVREVPVHHVEEVLNVTAVPKVTYREEPRITVREEITPFRRQIDREVEEVVPVPMEPPTVDTVRTIIRPETRLTPQYIRGEPQVVTKEETISYEYPYTVTREEVVLKNQVQKVSTPMTIDAPEERIIEVPEERVEYREVEVPEITTVRKVKYVPTFEMETSWRPREPIAGEPVARARDPRTVLGQMSFDQIDRDHDGVITREELAAAMGEGVPPEDHDGDRIQDELDAELRRLREQNRALEDEGRRMEEQLRRYQQEAEELAEELSKERRHQRELASRLQVEPQMQRSVLSPRQGAKAFYEPTLPQAGRPPQGRPPSVGRAQHGDGVGSTVRRAMGEWMHDA